MELAYSSASGDALRDELTSLISQERVEGLLVLATPSVDITADSFETTLESLSEIGRASCRERVFRAV